MTSSGTWPPGQTTTAEQQFASMGSIDSIGEQDFANLLDFESFDFLTNFEPSADSAHKLPNGGVDLTLLANAASQAQQHEGQRGGQPQQLPQGQNMFDMHMQMSFAQAQHGQQYSMAPNGHAIQPHPIIPPTPNSVEMHGDVGRYLQHLDAQTRAMLEHEYQMRKQEAVSCFALLTVLSALFTYKLRLPVRLPVRSGLPMSCTANSISCSIILS